ncbi:MAG: amino acid ABC transporter permease [Lachnospiraceae bacterium]|nr:amino acid ABC transporter permease [Lachnospiraceae bacterium]
MSNFFQVKTVFENIPEIIKYLPITLELAVVSFLISLLVGLILALIKIKRIPVLLQATNVFISVIRGTPVLVQLYVAYFGIPMFLKYINLQYGTNWNVNGVPAILYAIVALSLNQAAYNAETLRAALQSVEKGQIEAATTLGMTPLQTLIRIVIPEAFTVALPSLSNSFIAMIKSTSLAFVCAVVDMTAAGKIIGGRTYRYFEVYVSLAIIYWIITIVIEQAEKLIERKIRVPEDVPVPKKQKEERIEEHVTGNKIRANRKEAGDPGSESVKEIQAERSFG